MAIKNDVLVGDAWVGHPYYEVIDNSTDFEMKMRRLTKAVADKLDIANAEEWLDAKAVKLKFLVTGALPAAEVMTIRSQYFHHMTLILTNDRSFPGSETSQSIMIIFLVTRVDLRPGSGGGADMASGCTLTQ